LGLANGIIDISCLEEREIELSCDGIPRALQTGVADGIKEFRVKEERFTFLIEKVLPASRRKEKRRSL